MLKKSTINTNALAYKSQNPSKLYIETYGCQMNVNDTEVVVSILKKEGFSITETIADADLILINTCSVRENAEQRVRGRLSVFLAEKQKRPALIVGVIGCMAERLKTKLLEEEKVVDIVVGPDAYRDLPLLVKQAGTGQRSINVLLSREETYADIAPVRLDKGGVSSFVSIMRGCNNCCSYCIVPYTRGPERSRPLDTILAEVQQLAQMNYKEVTLLGQNVDSYNFQDTNFAALLRAVAQAVPEMRVRFSTSHPKDITDEVLETMASFPNICKSLHLPVQSGSTRMLEVMKRGYTAEWYLQRVEAVRKFMPNIALSTDIIAGFCSETEDDHQQSLDIIRQVKFDFAFMFKYSERPNTLAARKYPDDVPEETKTRRLQEIIELQNSISLEAKKACLGQTFELLVEGHSKRSQDEFCGRTSENRMVVFPSKTARAGDFVSVKIHDCTAATLLGKEI